MTPYPSGECTWYAAKTWAERYKSELLYFPRPPGSRPRHAKYWGELAQQYGIPLSAEPIVGAVGVWDIGDFGHVAVVEKVHPDGTVDVSEYNMIPKRYGERKNVKPARVYIIPPIQPLPPLPVDVEFENAIRLMREMGVYSEFTKPGDVITADRLAVFLARYHNRK